MIDEIYLQNAIRIRRTYLKLSNNNNNLNAESSNIMINTLQRIGNIIRNDSVGRVKYHPLISNIEFFDNILSLCSKIIFWI
jgi:hypothetical protein